jgi:hypothetical protein
LAAPSERTNILISPFVGATNAEIGLFASSLATHYGKVFLISFLNHFYQKLSTPLLSLLNPALVSNLFSPDILISPNPIYLVNDQSDIESTLLVEEYMRLIALLRATPSPDYRAPTVFTTSPEELLLPIYDKLVDTAVGYESSSDAAQQEKSFYCTVLRQDYLEATDFLLRTTLHMRSIPNQNSRRSLYSTFIVTFKNPSFLTEARRRRNTFLIPTQFIGNPSSEFSIVNLFGPNVFDKESGLAVANISLSMLPFCHYLFPLDNRNTVIYSPGQTSESISPHLRALNDRLLSEGNPPFCLAITSYLGSSTRLIPAAPPRSKPLESLRSYRGPPGPFLGSIIVLPKVPCFQQKNLETALIGFCQRSNTAVSRLDWCFDKKDNSEALVAYISTPLPCVKGNFSFASFSTSYYITSSLPPTFCTLGTDDLPPISAHATDSFSQVQIDTLAPYKKAVEAVCVELENSSLAPSPPSSSSPADLIPSTSSPTPSESEGMEDLPPSLVWKVVGPPRRKAMGLQQVFEGSLTTTLPSSTPPIPALNNTAVHQRTDLPSSPDGGALATIMEYDDPEDCVPGTPPRIQPKGNPTSKKRSAVVFQQTLIQTSTPLVDGQTTWAVVASSTAKSKKKKKKNKPASPTDPPNVGSG